jgi:predicted PurR-regulated permease PerM
VPDRRVVLTGMFVLAVTLAAALLLAVLPTVFFAITVAYLLVPLHRRLVGRGVPERWASLATTGIATVGALVPIVGVGYLVYRRRAQLVAALEVLPETLTATIAGRTYSVELATAREAAADWVSTVAVTVLQSIPVLALKVTLFAILVFALLARRAETARALLVPVPTSYYDVVGALHERTRATLYAIYVLQAATGLATFLVALPVFFGLGYEFPVSLAIVAGVLQFLPIVGPSVLLVVLAGYRVALSQTGDAALLLVVGGVLVAWLPDAIVRTRLAHETAGLPGSLYFVGFVGGLLTVGPVGIIAGPLVVALVSEVLDLLAPYDDSQTTLDDVTGTGKQAESDGSADGDAAEDRRD